MAVAVDPDLVDRITASIADLYRDVEGALVRVVSQRLRQDPPTGDPYELKLGAIRALQRAARAILDKLRADRGEVIRQAAAQAYGHGWGTALADLPTEWGRRRIGPAARRAIAEQVPNAAVIERIAAAIHRDVGRLDANILRAPMDAYRAVQAGTAARIATGAFTRRQAAQAAWQALIDRGIATFTDRAGRRWRLSSYVEMIARTNVQRAAVQGQTDRLTSTGIDLVIVSDSPRECPRCRPWERKVLSLSGRYRGRIRVEHATRDGEYVTVDVAGSLDEARSRGLQHPNCTHSISAYLPGVTRVGRATADPRGYEAKQRQRAIERQIRRWKERAEGALTDQGRKAAQAKVRAWQKELRDHLQANPGLKRLRYREQIGAGNIPRGGQAPGGAVTLAEPRELAPAPAAPARRPAAQRPVTPRPAPAPAPAQPRMEVPAVARPYHRSIEGIEDLVRRVETQREVESRRLGGLSAQTELVTLADGTKVIRKSARAGLDEMQDAAAEHAVSLIARKLGLRAPGVYRRDDRHVYMEYVGDAQTADEIARGVDELPTRLRQAIDSDEGKLLGLLDLLTMNIDRNQGNWMLDQRGRLIPIDHGAAFVNSLGDPAADLEYVNSPFADHYKADRDQLKDNPLTPADVEEIRRRLNELRPDFAHMGRESWLDYALAVLDLLAGHAKGTRNLIAK